MTIKFKKYGDYLGDGDYKIHDDIQIEGFSLQESLLKYFKKREIDKNVINYQKDKEYTYTEFRSNNYKTFDVVGFYYKSDDKSYTIHCVSAHKFTKKTKSTQKKLEKIIDKIKIKLDKKYKNNEYFLYGNQPPYTKKVKESVFKYPNKKPYGNGSKSKKIYYNFSEDATIQLATYEWAKDAEPTWFNNVDISYSTFDFNEWLAVQSENY